MAENKTMIHQYIRHPKTNARRGVAVAVLCDGNVVRYGISLHKKSDKANPEQGMKTAVNRAIKCRSGPIIGVEHTADMIAHTMAHLKERAQRYFKDASEFQSAPTFTVTRELADAKARKSQEGQFAR